VTFVKKFLLCYLARYNRGFYLLCRSEKISNAEDVQGGDVASMLGVFKRYMDYTHIDLLHDLSEKTLSAIESVDALLLVAQQSLPVLRSFRQNCIEYRAEGGRIFAYGGCEAGRWLKGECNHSSPCPRRAGSLDPKIWAESASYW